MFVRRGTAALIGSSIAGLAFTALAVPAHANTDVNITEASPGWSAGSSYPSQINHSAIIASEETATPITFRITGPTGLQDQSVWVKPFASEETASQPFFRQLYEDAAFTKDCQSQSNCRVTSDGTPTTLYVNPDPVATYVRDGLGPATDPAAQPISPFRIGFVNMSDGQRPLTFGGVNTGLTVTYGVVPNPDSGDGGNSGGTGSPSAAPGPHIQQFGVPESGTCDEAASDDLNWSGVESGGWGESWAQWINDGEGGFVCTRTLVYNTSQGAWEVD